MTDPTEFEETPNIVRNLREKVQDLNQRAEQQKAALHLTADSDFLSPIPKEEDSTPDFLSTENPQGGDDISPLPED